MPASVDGYLAHLKSGETSLFLPTATLNYIPNTLTFTGIGAITRHLADQKKKQAQTVSVDLISIIETADTLVLEVETKIKFINGGSAWVPSVEHEDLLEDKIVIIPVMHIVTFEGGQIKQVRLYWDQGGLLKQIREIGGRLPIAYGVDQVKSVKTCVAALEKTPSKMRASMDTPQEPQTPAPANGNTKRISRDPHASLSLFGPKTEEPAVRPMVSSRNSARPAARNLTDILGGESDSLQNTPKAADLNASPRKNPAPIRAFGAHGEEQDFDTPPQKAKSYQTHPKKYHHFEFGEGEDAAPTPMTESKIKHFEFGDGEDAAPTPSAKPSKVKHFEFGDGEDAAPTLSQAGKPVRKYYNLADEEGAVADVRPQSKSGRDFAHRNGSNWDFGDFSTPDKKAPKIRSQEERHFGWSDDDDTDSPVKQKAVPKPRKDADTHFEITDDTTPQNGGPLGRLPNAGNHPRREQVSQFSIQDDSPATAGKPKKISADRLGVVKMMENHWVRDNENQPDVNEEDAFAGFSASQKTTKINISGDASGSRKQPGHGDSKGYGPAADTKGYGSGHGDSKGYEKAWGWGESPASENTRPAAAGSENVKPTTTTLSRGRAKQTEASGGGLWDY